MGKSTLFFSHREKDYFRGGTSGVFTSADSAQFRWQISFFETQELLGAEEQVVLVTCQDLSEELRLYTKERGYLPVIAFAQIDNRGEVLKDMAEEAKPLLLGATERILREWAEKFGGVYYKAL